jgi:hypothetical protein
VNMAVNEPAVPIIRPIGLYGSQKRFLFRALLTVLSGR